MTAAAVFERRAKEINADLALLSDVREWAACTAHQAGFRNGDCYQLKLAMSEAVANAIQHGSGAESDAISLAAFEQEGALVFEVCDTGTFRQPATSAKPEDERGRGLELLGLMMDDVEICAGDNGSRLRFAKRLR